MLLFSGVFSTLDYDSIPELKETETRAINVHVLSKKIVILAYMKTTADASTSRRKNLKCDIFALVN